MADVKTFAPLLSIRPWRLARVAALLAIAFSCDATPVVEYGYDARPQTSSCRGPDIPPPYRLAEAYPGIVIEKPSDIVPVSDALAFVVSQVGIVYRVHREADGWFADPFLDVTAELGPPHGEAGLLGLALAPDFATSGDVYVSYTGKSDIALFRLVVARYKSDGVAADANSATPIFSLERDMQGHNGGKLRFGPDGYLYLGVGDGSWGDPARRAQSPDELFGKILRLKVSAAEPGYRSPDDNPFARGGGRAEVFALGLRNPWTFSFDGGGRLWVGDVGHERFEEIDVVTKGGNYGWPLREAAHCFAQDPCDVPGLVDPVAEYSHVNGFAVVGGFVYRGAEAALQGRYLFGDFISGRMWSLDAASPRSADPSPLLLDTGLNLSGIAEGPDGSILTLDYNGGRVMRLERVAPRPALGTTLRALGCIDDGAVMNGDLVPYEVNAPLWADGLGKRRWFSLPSGAQIHVRDDGSWELPVGALLLKELSTPTRRVETRMMVRDADFDWLFYTFQWNAEGTDAELVDEGRTVDLDGGGTWNIPSRGQCLSCHGAGAGRVLGFEVAQLNRALTYPTGRSANQVATLGHVGYLDRRVDPLAAPPLPNPYGTVGTEEARARAYLHANCSFCHRPTGGQGIFDFRAWVKVSEMGAVCRLPSSNDFGVQDAQIIAPGDPERSMVVHRMAQQGAGRMPPLGTSIPDQSGVQVLSRWIRSLQGCE